jgi:hypothetical protein
MPPPLSSFSGLFNATAKPFVKNIGPLSSSVIRQQQSFTTENKPIVTESAVLNSFPRPNLQPTLQSSQTMSRLQMLKTLGATQTCFNCSGPHSTDYCPC